MTGVEGYVESASSGFVAGLNAALLALGSDPVIFTPDTEICALSHYISRGGVSSSFQPMNANFGIIAPFDKKVKGGKKARNEAYAKRSLEVIDSVYADMFNNENIG
jgi:methylenetetrahydrofolate--tRNA-(uracil-5-)-methyltransferase